MATKPKIPEHVRFMAQAKQKTKEVASEMLEGAKTAIKRNAPKLAGRMKAKATGKQKRNPWMKCQTCYRRVPQICPDCMSGAVGVTPTHKTACCPGPCEKCGMCLNYCMGHEKDDRSEDETTDQAGHEDEADDKEAADAPETEGRD